MTFKSNARDGSDSDPTYFRLRTISREPTVEIEA